MNEVSCGVGRLPGGRRLVLWRRVEPFGGVREYLFWRRTVVHVSVSVGSSVSLSSGCGSQRHDSETTRQVRVGLECVHLSKTERAIIAVLEKLGAAW